MFACTAYGAAAGAASIAGIITGIIAYVATRKPQQIPVAEVIDRIIQGVQLQQINGAFATMHRADVIGSFVLANAQSWVIHNYDTVKSVVANIDGNHDNIASGNCIAAANIVDGTCHHPALHTWLM